MELWEIWIVAAMAFLIMELVIPRFIAAAIGVGCLAAALADGMGQGIERQIGALSTVIIFFFLTLRPLFLDYLDSDTGIKTNIEALIGAMYSRKLIRTGTKAGSSSAGEIGK